MDDADEKENVENIDLDEPEGSEAGEESAGAGADAKPKKKKPGKKNSRKKLIALYILLGISIAAVIVCAVGLGLELYTARKSIAYYETLNADIEKRPGTTVNPGNPGNSTAAAVTPGTPSTERPQLPSGNTPDAVGDLPVIKDDNWVPYVNFEALGERFPGIVAWIKLDGTLLDYPVMQGTDNAFYLSHLPDGTRDRAGSVFLDYRNSPDFSDKNSLVYGHMSKVGEMFGALKEYRNQAFYDAHPVINLYTAEHDYEIVLIAGYLVDSGVETPPLSFSNDAAFERYIANLKSRSVFRSAVGADAGDRLVCLCTCAYDFTNARLVIVGKLVEVSWTAGGSMLTQ